MKTLTSWITAVIVAAASLIAFDAPAANATGDFRVHHWNMCGNKCPMNVSGVDHDDAPAVVLYIAATSNPKPPGDQPQ